MQDESERSGNTLGNVEVMTFPCPECGGRIPVGKGKNCGGCGYTTAKDEEKKDDELRVVEAFPLEGERVLLALRSGVQVVHRVTRSRLEAQGEGSPDISSRRLKLLPRTDGRWIVFDNMQPMARGDVQVCRSLHAACVALGAWVQRERSPAGIPLAAPVPRPPGAARPRTMTEVARMQAPVAAATAPDKTVEAAPELPKRGSRKWPGCGHRRFPGEDACRFCVAQVLMPGIAGTKPTPA